MLMAMPRSRREATRMESVALVFRRCSSMPAPMATHPAYSGMKAHGYGAPKARAPHEINARRAAARQDMPGGSARFQEGVRGGVCGFVREAGNDGTKLAERAVHVTLERQFFELGDLSAEQRGVGCARRTHAHHLLDGGRLRELVVADELLIQLFSRP